MPRESISADCGFAPEKLDGPITGAIDRLTKVVADVERIRGALEPQLDEIRRRIEKQLTDPSTIADPALLVQAERMIEFLEKYARVSLNLTKVVDETARLRSFAAGGADQRPDLSSLSDTELAKIVQDAARTATVQKS
jgi:hypothetical protein